jgi:uncharacterized protein YndB with AHSA1/START domain
MATGTVRLHRVLRAPPERVYKAFTEATAFPKWYPPYGFTCQVEQFEAKVGGRMHMSFTNVSTGSSHSFGGVFNELVPNERIVFTDAFDDQEFMAGQMVNTIVLKKVLAGTELSIVQEGIPERIPLEMCYLGWQECLLQLAKLVEPEIPDDPV